MRTWKVAHTSENTNGKKVITRYFVTDAETNEELDTRPIVAEFPISQKFDQESQEARAYAYATYMGKIDEATRQAYENNQLLDILKA
jgi:hypothetical protein